jgi:hypothetical protein
MHCGEKPISEGSQSCQENMVMSPVGFGTKNHCAAEHQQQVSGQLDSFSRIRIRSYVPTGPETKNDCAG